MKNFNSILMITMLMITVIFNSFRPAYAYGSLRQDTTLQDIMPFPMGAAVSMKYIKDSLLYRNLVINEFNSITGEGAMKMTRLQPSQGVFDFADGDYLVDFAEQYNKRIHGHTLIWGKVPDWVTNFVGDSTAWENLMKTHIQTVAAHFKGKVASWDVVNEAIDDDGSVKNNIWRQKLGKDYIARAFQYAHEADSGALLFYNDFGHEYSKRRRDSINALVTSLKNRGIPIHGTGMQMHTRYNLEQDGWLKAINESAATGLKVHISELDMFVNVTSDSNMVLTPDIARQQADQYRFIVRNYNAIPQEQQFGITQWNVSDKDTWIRGSKDRPDWPLPFDDNYQRKPAYYAMIEGLQDRSFAGGNIVVMRYGNGTVTSGAVPVSLEEYPAQANAVMRQRIDMPGKLSGSNFRFVGQELSTAAPNYLSLSTNKRHLLLTGYDAATGTSDVRSYSISGASRILGIVDALGNVNTSIYTNSAYTSGLYMAVGDSNGVWLTGNSNGIRYLSLDNPTSKPTIASTPTTSRSIGIFGDQLYALSTNVTGSRFMKIGTGLPTTSGQTYTNVPGLPTSGGSYRQFVFLDTDATPGTDVLYFTDDVAGTINKYSLNTVSGSWVSRGSYSITGTGTNVTALTGKYDDEEDQVVLYTTTPNRVLQVIDTAINTATISASQLTVVTNATSNTEFRGVAFAPEKPAILEESLLESQTLPVTIGELIAQKQGNAVILKWNTSSERNNSHFNVLRSVDGKTFHPIGYVSGKGTLNKESDYSFADNFPSLETAYYRLQQLDYDGRSSKSRIVSVFPGLKDPDFKVYFSGNKVLNASFYSDKTADAVLYITDLKGGRLYSKKVKLNLGDNSVIMNDLELSTGIYIATMAKEGKTYSLKFIK